MKVILSWSGTLSQVVAQALRTWLPEVIQHVEPWMSTEDVRKGAVWHADLFAALSETSVGIICVTRDNIGSAWLNFEAGALGRALPTSRVCTFLHGLKPT